MKKEKRVIDLDKKRLKINALKILKLLRVPIVIVVVLAAIFLSARLLGNVATSNITDAIRAIPTLFSPAGKFPYSTDSLSFRRADLIGNDILMIGTDYSKVISSSPRERFNYQLESADSKAVSENGRALVFSNSSSSVILQSKTEKLGSITAEGAIKTADLADNGWFAISFSTESAQSAVEVYNNRFGKEFRWNCSKEFVSALGLSDNGKTIALGAIGSENAAMYSRLIIFNVKTGKSIFETRYDGTVILKIIYTASDKIIVIGDNKTVIYNKKGESENELDYSENSLIATDSDDKGNTVICYREFGGARSEIVRFSANGKKTCELIPELVPECISCKGSRFAISSGTDIILYSSKGEHIKDSEAKNDVHRLLLTENNIFTVEGDSICKY